METKSASDRPAVEAIGKDIEARVGPLGDEQKKLVGRWVKEVLAPRGWRPIGRGGWRQAISFRGERFTVGSFRRLLRRTARRGWPLHGRWCENCPIRPCVRTNSLPSVAAPLTETNEVCPRCVCACWPDLNAEPGADRVAAVLDHRRRLSGQLCGSRRRGSREAAIARSGCARSFKRSPAPSFPPTRKWRLMSA